ncbi:MAG: hypothetical protein WA705_05825 [Candidatus Ozemobacteraceae bacterium]
MPFLLLRIFLLVSLVFGTPASVLARAPEAQIIAFTFDWDDNIFQMPTKIMVFHKKTGEELPLSTADFALVRSEIGKPGTKYADYQLCDSNATGSMRYFGDFSEDGIGRFQKDIDEALTGKSENWQGPVWNDFVTAMSRNETASHTWLITARLHSARTIHDALGNLQKRGLLKNVPPVENIWAVNDPEFPVRFRKTFGAEPPAGSAANPSARKATVMEQILDQIEKTEIPSKAIEVLGPDGKTRGRFHLWGFSDDDYGNFEKATQVLQKGIDSGRWKTVKLTIFFTGKRTPGKQPCAVTLFPGNPPRPFTEVTEWKKILELATESSAMQEVPSAK